MSFRHHIHDFMRARMIGKDRRRAKNNRCCQGLRHRSQRCFYGCGSHLKLLECVVDGTGEVVLEVRRLQKIDISSYQQKRNRRTTAQQVANQFLAASGKQISRKTVTSRLRGGGLYARRPVLCVPLTRKLTSGPFAMVS
ncbi:hypothetical protein TNCV_522631 [Trichonephila clavipes]|nr:hypothetical protein TNCV_522631 [Trichonephila clavipes]